MAETPNPAQPQRPQAGVTPPVPPGGSPNPQGAAPAAPQPAAPAAPSPVAYAPDDAYVRTVVDGKAMDMKVSDLRASAQLRSAAEKRLNEANRLMTENRSLLERRGDLDALDRVRTMARTDPQAAQEEAARLLGLRPRPGADNSVSQPDGDEAPETRALRAELTALREEVNGINQFRNQIATQETVRQVKAIVREYPLYQRDEGAARRAETIVAAYMANNPDASLREVAGVVHAEDTDFVTRQLQAQRDQRAQTAEQLVSLPPGVGTPGTTPVEVATPDKGSFLGDGWKKGQGSLRHLVQQLKGNAGL